MIGDRELLAFRAGYYGVLVSLLWREPAAELLGALEAGLAARVAGARGLNAHLAAGWTHIASFLAAVPPAERAAVVADEYTRLFLSPWGAEVHPYESYYLTGRTLDRPLAEVRGTLAELGIEKAADYAEPEDFIAFELDVMRRLVDRQRQAGDPDAEAALLRRQAVFLHRHLLVWAPTAAQDMTEADHARFYRGVGEILLGFLELEGENFAGWAAQPVATIEEARRRLAGSGQWRGPLLDLPEPPGVEREPPEER